jgi:hypothetical protein
VVGAVSGGLALAQARSVTANCNGTQCRAVDEPAAHAAMIKGWVSNVGFGVGVVGVVAGIIVLAVRRGPPKSPPPVTPSAQGIVVRF